MQSRDADEGVLAFREKRAPVWTGQLTRASGRAVMAFVIAETCIDVKDGVCTEVCPVDCIYEGGRMYYIQPDECVDCALCVSVCPVEAIWPDDELPAGSEGFAAVNAEFFGECRDRLGPARRPGSRHFRTDKDHPVVAAWDAGGG